VGSRLWAHVERVGWCEQACSGLIRIYEDGDTWGDPYRYAFPFRMVADDTIELYGIAGRAPTIEEARTMLAEVKQRGWRVVRERKSGWKPGVRAPGTQET
jgi:hypothetical protein